MWMVNSIGNICSLFSNDALQRPVSTEKHVSPGLLYAAVKIKVTRIHATKALEMNFHSFVTLALDGGGW